MNEGFRRLLVFTLRDEKYALDLREVAEVLEPTPTFPIPRAPRFFSGIINFHGSLVAVLDLAMFFGGKPGTAAGKILVADRNIANLAFQVDAVENIVSEEVLLEEREGDDDMTARHLVMADGEIRELSVNRILESLEAIISGEGM